MAIEENKYLSREGKDVLKEATDIQQRKMVSIPVSIILFIIGLGIGALIMFLIQM